MSQPPETPPWETPTSKWFTPINTPCRTTPTPIPLIHEIPETPKLDGLEPDSTKETMTLLQLRPSRTNPWIWCGAALCFIFSLLLIIFGIATLILFLTIRPRTPVFDITNAKLNTIYFESPLYFNGDLLMLLNFTNPNKKLNVKFENLSIELLFSNKLIATQSLVPFSERNGKMRLEPIRLISNLVLLPVNHAVELKRQVENNKIEYEIRGNFKVRAHLGVIRYSYWLHGSCQLQMTGPPTGNLVSRNCTTKRW